MRAYLAILKDSFREALASRVLLIALIAIVVVLALIAPFGIREDRALELRRTEIPRPDLLLTALTNGETETGTPAAHLWSLMSDEQRKSLKDWQSPEAGGERAPRRSGGRSVSRDILQKVNELLRSENFYDADAWSDISLDEEAQTLVEQTDLSEEDTQRRNLLVFASAFPRAIRIVDSNSLSITYANASVVDALPITPTQFETIFERVLIAVIAVFLGFFGVFASLLMTAAVIPRTFEPGEISLLLSKPITRTGLFVTKFIGGCIFTLLYATVMVVGLWLLLGIRIDYWNSALLWCIPVYVLLFMIYYSVSAVAGAIWRNSIVALALVVCFWIGITVVGEVHEELQRYLIGTRGIKEVVPTNAGVFVVDGEQKTYLWDDSRSEWDEVFEAAPMPGVPGFARRILRGDTRFLPVFDSANERLLVLEQVPARFGGVAPPELQVASAKDDWSRTPLGRLPDFASTILLTSDGTILLPCEDAIYRYVGQTEKDRQQGDFLRNLTGGLMGSSSEAFANVTPNGYPELHPQFAATLDPASSDVFLHSRGKLFRLSAAEDQPYEVVASQELDDQSNAVIAAAGQHGILATADGNVIVFDLATLDIVTETQLPDGVVPRVCSAADDGSTLAVLTHDETVALFDGATGESIDWVPPENTATSALAFDAEGNLFVSDGRLAVRKYDLESQSRQAEWSQATTWVYQFYDYAIVPAWTLLPKPRELDRFVTFVMTGNSTVVDNEENGPPGMANRESLQQDRSLFDPWTTLRDNIAFIVVMLAIGCFYIARRDF